MPWGDVQFYVVTALMLLAVVALVRQFWPGRRSAGGCGGTGTQSRRANLTIEGHRAAPPSDGGDEQC